MAARQMTLRFDPQGLDSQSRVEKADDLVNKIQQALDLASEQVSLADFASVTGSSVAAHESIPAAFGVVLLANHNAWNAAVLAANIGDDTDTIGSMSAAMAASCAGASALPPDKRQRVIETNDLKLNRVVNDLLKLRHSRSCSQTRATVLSATASGLPASAYKQ